MTGPAIRDLAGMAEFRQAEALQTEVWGREDLPDPADLMMVIQAEGGLCAGAFDGDRLVGYVFAFPTATPGVQHSHRLAVRAEARGTGLGAALKWYQRRWCLARGITRVRWTFDPLRRVNAGLNIATLGCIGQVYHSDYYGEMQGINAGLPSDRLLADWQLEAPAVAALAEGRRPPPLPPTRSLPLPADIDRLLREDPAEALAQRLHHRKVLTQAFAEGEAILGYDRAQGCYLLGRP